MDVTGGVLSVIAWEWRRRAAEAEPASRPTSRNRVRVRMVESRCRGGRGWEEERREA